MEFSTLPYSYYFEHFSSLSVSFFNNMDRLGVDVIFLKIIDLVFYVYMFIFFKVLLFSFFFSSQLDDKSNDLDSFTSSALVECEKEVSAIDDLIAMSSIVLFVFGLYFGITCFSQIFNFFSSLSFLDYIFPIFFFFYT